MSRSVVVAAVVLLSAMLVFSGQVFGQETAGGLVKQQSDLDDLAQEAQEAEEDEDVTEVEAEEENVADPAMAAWVEAGTPGENHALLRPLEGRWVARTKSYRDSTKVGKESRGNVENTWILGGRFLRQEFKGDFNGQPFEGFGLIGYDNLKNKFVSIWADNMTTMILSSEGSADRNARTFTFKGEYNDPVNQGRTNRSTRHVLRIASEKEHVLEIYEIGPDGKEFRALEIIYTRS